MKEIFKDIPGYEGRYQASNMGNIRSKRLRKPFGWIVLKATDLKGRRRVSIGSRGFRKSFLAYRLVAMAFLENPLNKKEINHIDGNMKNDVLQNIEWCTRLENSAHAVRTGLQPKGSRCPHSKIKDSDAIEIVRLRSLGLKRTHISRLLGISYWIVMSVLRGIAWSHATGLPKVANWKNKAA